MIQDLASGKHPFSKVSSIVCHFCNLCWEVFLCVCVCDFFFGGGGGGDPEEGGWKLRINRIGFEH